MSEVSNTKKLEIYLNRAWSLFLVSVIAAGIYFFGSLIYDSFEIPYDDYETFSFYLNHEFCGDLARDYASDGRVTVYEYLVVSHCSGKDEKRKFYSELEAQ
ncbi:hypothetical protein NDI96_13460 [Vibrio alginolyticus]|uniref:hypothetical protein n=1 Tax=Vibrio alginolyticus TaxID=663 RepID=UPI002160E04B|nr:hypothetical protein [Vibrio alginolyticus]MCS0181364.1 hypothetical protein [Vibrio alginolyticus]